MEFNNQKPEDLTSKSRREYLNNQIQDINDTITLAQLGISSYDVHLNKSMLEHAMEKKQRDSFKSRLCAFLLFVGYLLLGAALMSILPPSWQTKGVYIALAVSLLVIFFVSYTSCNNRLAERELEKREEYVSRWQYTTVVYPVILMKVYSVATSKHTRSYRARFMARNGEPVSQEISTGIYDWFKKKENGLDAYIVEATISEKEVVRIVVPVKLFRNEMNVSITGGNYGT